MSLEDVINETVEARVQEAYVAGQNDGARVPMELLVATAAWLQMRATELRKQADECDAAAGQILNRMGTRTE